MNFTLFNILFKEIEKCIIFELNWREHRQKREGEGDEPAENGKTTDENMFLCFSPSSSPPADSMLFLQTVKGQDVLQQVKDFMRQHVLPAQEVCGDDDRPHCTSCDCMTITSESFLPCNKKRNKT